MKARELLGAGATPDGSTITLHREATGDVVRIGNEVLMSSRLHGSEQQMAALCLESALRSSSPRVLIGGLGMGFTLRAALDVLPPRSEVVVAELLACVVEWNRGPLAAHSHDALTDRRVHVEIADVQDVVRRAGRVSSARFDAILLDVDNGPDALTTAGNRGIYSRSGLEELRAALRPGGVLGVWSASRSRTFEKALARADFRAETVELASRSGSRKGARHVVFVGRTGRASPTKTGKRTRGDGGPPAKFAGRRPHA